MHKQKEQEDRNLLGELQRESWQPPSPPPDFADRVLAALNAPEAKAPPLRTTARRPSGPTLLAAAGSLALAGSFALGVLVSPRILSTSSKEEEVGPLVTAVRPDSQIDPKGKGEPEMQTKSTAALALGSALAAVSPFFFNGAQATPASSGPGDVQKFCGEVFTSCYEPDGEDVLLCEKVIVFCEEAGVPLPFEERCEEEGPHPHKHNDNHSKHNDNHNDNHNTSKDAPEPFQFDFRFGEDWEEHQEAIEEIGEEIEELSKEIEELRMAEAEIRFKAAAEGAGDGTIPSDIDQKLQKAKKKLQKELKKLKEAQKHLKKYATPDPFAPEEGIAPPAPPSAPFDPFAPAPPAPPRVPKRSKAHSGDELFDPFAPAPPAPPAQPNFTVSLDDTGMTIRLGGIEGLSGEEIEEILKEIEGELEGELGKIKKKELKKLRKKIERELKERDDDDD